MSFTTISNHAPVRLYRSKLFVPGSRPALFEKAAASAADVVCLDLEDAVAPSDKEAARDNIVVALNEVNWGNKTVTVRINGLSRISVIAMCWRWSRRAANALTRS